MRLVKMKRRYATEVGSAPRRWITVFKMAAPWSLSVDHLDLSIMIPNYPQFWGETLTWENELAQIKNKLIQPIRSRRF